MDMKDEPKGGMKDVAIVLGAPGKGSHAEPDVHEPDADADDSEALSPAFEQHAKDLYAMAQSKGSAKEFAMALHDAMRCFLDEEESEAE